jgi:hypothetical protein
MQLYCESNNHSGIVIFDVGSLQELEKLWNKVNNAEWDSNDTRSLIEISDLMCLPYKGPREGYWYDIPFSFWESFSFDFETYSLNNENPNLLFRLKAFYKNKEHKLNFYNYILDRLDEKEGN